MKIIGVTAIALAINFGLFLLMDSMISRDRMRVVNLIDSQSIDFVRTQINEETRTRDRRTPPPPKPQEIQRPRAQVQNIANRVSSLPMEVAAFEVSSLLGDSGGVAIGQTLTEGNLGSLESLGSLGSLDIMMAEDLIPLTVLPPQYPPSARLRNIEGWVELAFTVTAEGRVIDPVVIESDPEEIFDQAAMDAALRWRFRPVSRNGVAESVTALIRVSFKF